MLLFTEHIVFWFSLWVSFGWGILYLFLLTVSDMLKVNHGFNTMQVGLAFLGMILGGMIGFAISPISDYFYSRASMRNHGKPRPEARLYFSCVGGLMFCSGLFWFGWSSGPNVHWIVPILAIGWTTIGIYSIYVPPPPPPTPYSGANIDGGIQLPSGFIHDIRLLGARGTKFRTEHVRLWISPFLSSNEPKTRIRLEYEFIGYYPPAIWADLGFIALALSATPFILMFYGPRIR
jgi:hypothetical protein